MRRSRLALLEMEMGVGVGSEMNWNEHFVAYREGGHEGWIEDLG